MAGGEESEGWEEWEDYKFLNFTDEARKATSVEDYFYFK